MNQEQRALSLCHLRHNLWYLFQHRRCFWLVSRNHSLNAFQFACRGAARKWDWRTPTHFPATLPQYQQGKAPSLSVKCITEFNHCVSSSGGLVRKKKVKSDQNWRKHTLSKIGQTIFWGPFQPSLFYESMKIQVILNNFYPLLQIDDNLTLQTKWNLKMLLARWGGQKG